MAALTNTVPFKNAVQTCGRRPAGCPRRTLVCRAQAEEHGWQRNLGVQLLAAGLAATTLVGHPCIAEAGVVLEQPKTKKLFQKSSTPRPEPQESSGGGPSLPSIGLPSVGLPSISGPDLSGLNIAPADALDPRKIALPGAIVGIAAAGFAAFKFDTGFKSMMREGLVKDSTGYAGYEQAVDEYAAAGAKAVSKGTKKISKAVKGKGTKSGKGGFFGRK